MKNKQKAIITTLTIAMMSLAGCASTSKPEEEARIQKVIDTRTVLDAHKAEVQQVEARLVLLGQGGHLNNAETNDLTRFADDYVKLGRGNVVISYPQGGANDGASSALVRDIQKQLYIAGIDFKNITFGAYQAGGQPNQPIVVSFIRYEAKEVECIPWSQIDPVKTAKNSTTANFGCAINSNLAAMIENPADLLGDREPGKRDAATTSVGIEKYRKGEVEQVSGSISSGGGQ